MNELFNAIAKRMPLDQLADSSRGRNRAGLNSRGGGVDLENSGNAANAGGCACKFFIYLFILFVGYKLLNHFLHKVDQSNISFSYCIANHRFPLIISTRTYSHHKIRYI